jgi:hypothetical protein
VTPENTTEGSRIKRATEKIQLFDPRKEKQTFDEARRKFGGEHASLSKAQLEVR